MGWRYIIWILLLAVINNETPAAHGQGISVILEQTVEQMGISRRLFISQQTKCYFLDASAPIIVNETLMYRFPDRFRAEMVTESGWRVHIVSAGKTVTLIDERLSPAAESGMLAFKEPLLYRTPEGLQQLLRDRRINDQVITLGRFLRQTAYVIGAEFPDLSVPQLWIDKDTFLPFRHILVNSSKINKTLMHIEFRYLDWRTVKGVQYPFTVEIYENHQLSLLMKVEQAVVDPTFGDDLFDIQAVKQRARLKDDGNWEQDRQDPLDEVREIIEKFKQRFMFDNED